MKIYRAGRVNMDRSMIYAIDLRGSAGGPFSPLSPCMENMINIPSYRISGVSRIQDYRAKVGNMDHLE